MAIFRGSVGKSALGIKKWKQQSCTKEGCTQNFSVVQDERLQPHNSRARFEQVVLPHLDAAYNLTRWLTRNEHDAEDGLKLEKLSPGASQKDFTVKASFRRSEKDAPQSVCGS